MITSKPSVNAETALKLVDHAFAHAKSNGWRIAVAVVDASGIGIASLRMDDVAPPIAEFALDKAYTAATMKRSTEAFFARMDSQPSLRLGFSNRQRLMVWGGGLPIFFEGRVVGGIGVSGAQDFEDIACAKTALAALGLSFEAG